MMDTTDRTPAQMAAHLTDSLLFAAEARRTAESHRDESISRRKPDLAAYWAQVADIITTASER